MEIKLDQIVILSTHIQLMGVMELNFSDVRRDADYIAEGYLHTVMHGQVYSHQGLIKEDVQVESDLFKAITKMIYNTRLRGRCLNRTTGVVVHFPWLLEMAVVLMNATRSL